MALKKWTTGDTITERFANNVGIRKGTESEIAAIALADREDGDYFWNSTVGLPQVQTDATNDKRGNLGILLGADSTEVTNTGVTPTLVKDTDFIKCAEGFKGNQITIVAMIKTDNGGTTAHLVVEHDGGPADDLDLTTTSTSYVKVTGTIDITGLSSDAVHTLEFYIYDGSGDTISLKELEVYGI